MKKKAKILTIEEYMQQFKQFFLLRTINTMQIKEEILNFTSNMSSAVLIDTKELDEEIRKINPLILALIANVYYDKGYEDN